MCLIIFILFFGMLPGKVYGQAYSFRNISVNEGLPHGQIYDVHQSANGLVWIATAASGLVRYDGINFRIYGMSEGLRDDTVTNIYEDSSGTLWVATYTGGIARMEGDQFVYPFEDSILDEAFLISITEGPDGRIWFGTFDYGVFIYDGSGLSNISTTHGLLDSSVWDVHWAEDGAVWFATHQGISVMRDSEFQNFTVADGLSGDKVFRIQLDQNGTKWFATSKGITRYTENGFETIHEINGRSLSYVFDLLITNKGRVWIGMESDGIYWYDDGVFTHLTRDDGLASNYIYKLYEDTSGRVWVSTDERGISIFSDDSILRYNTRHGLVSDEILSMLTDSKGTQWVGTYGGLHIYTDKGFLHRPLDGYSGVDAAVWDIVELDSGRLLLLMGNSELLEFDGTLHRLFNPHLPVDNPFITDILPDGNRLWIGTEEGLYKREDGVTERIAGLPGVIIQHLLKHSSGDIWVGTNTGAARITTEGIRTYTLADGLGHYNINVVVEDLQGNVWLGTSAGFTRILENPLTGETMFQNFGRETGMKLVETMFLYFDSSGFLWQGTNGGIHRFDLKAFEATGSMEAEHLRLSRLGFGVETMVDGVMSIFDDVVWFATMEGIAVVDTRKYANRLQAANKVFIETITVDGDVVNWGAFGAQPMVENSLQQFPQVRFPSRTSSFRFEFAGLEYLNPDNQHFRYRLIGLENDWNQNQGQNWVSYSNLGPGKYTFEVASRTGNGPWSETASYSFSIAVPYWQTPWFWLFSIGAAVLLLVLAFNYQVKRAEHKLLKKLVEDQTRDIQKSLDERTILLKEIHHRVKNNLSIIHGLLEIQMDSLNDEQVISAFNESQLRIMSIALVHEKLYQNENLSRIGIHQYIPDLLEAANRSMKKPDTNIQVHLNLDEIELSLEQAIPCGLIMNELISNVHKHAFKGRTSGEVHIDLHRQNGHCVFKMQDNGIGLPADFDMGTSDSIGLMLVNALIVQLEGEMCYRNENGAVFEMKFMPDLSASF